jgi:hypothetical protein
MACEMTGVGVKPLSWLDHDLDAVGGEHFERGRCAGAGERVRILAHEKRAGRCLALRYSQMAWVMARMCCSVNVEFERRAAMAAGAEADELRGIRGSGLRENNRFPGARHRSEGWLVRVGPRVH